MLGIGLGIWRLFQEVVTGGGVPDTTPAPKFDLIWGAATQLTWGSNTIIDWPVIEP